MDELDPPTDPDASDAMHAAMQNATVRTPMPDFDSAPEIQILANDDSAVRTAPAPGGGPRNAYSCDACGTRLGSKVQVRPAPGTPGRSSQRRCAENKGDGGLVSPFSWAS